LRYASTLPDLAENASGTQPAKKIYLFAQFLLKSDVILSTISQKALSMKTTNLNRRNFISTLFSLTAGLTLLSGNAMAASRKPRPPGTCGGWTDKDSNGCCDRSEKSGGCGDEECPGHVDNSRRKRISRKGAPAGTCASWEESKENCCEHSTDEDKPCIYTVCPANKYHA
jgi:hypothetical protein